MKKESYDLSYLKNALALWSAKDKYIKEKFALLLKTFSGSHCITPLAFESLQSFQELLELPCDSFVTEKEWQK